MYKNKVDYLILSTIILSFFPFFLMLNGTSISLPTSFYESNGIPLHVSFLLIIFLFFKYFKKNIFEYFLLFFLLFFNLIFSVNRTILFFQAIQPFFFYVLISKIDSLTIKLTIKYLLYIFIIIFLSNLIYGLILSSFNVLQLKSFLVEYFFNLKFYQSLLSFPLVLNSFLVLIIYQHKKYGLNKLFFLVSNILIILIQLFLTRKVAIFDSLLIYYIFYPKTSKIYLLILIFFILIFSIDYTNLELIDRIFNADSYTTRENTWDENLLLLSNTKNLIFGVNENTYAHNYFLGQIITFGIPTFLICFFLNFYYLFKYKIFKNKFLVTLILIFFIDSLFNSNLTQTYTVFAFVFIFNYIKNDKINAFI